MTVRELLTSVTFDQIADALRFTHQNCASIRDMASYKEAYDQICHLDFDGDGGKVTFDITPREQWFAPGSLPLLANDVEGDLWTNTVGKEVVLPIGNPFDNAQLAGAILWGMTFYGFTDRDRSYKDDDDFGRYGLRANLLEGRQDLPYIRDKKVRQEIKTSRQPVALSMEMWDEIELRRQHQNRSKRKRYHRLELRVDELRRLDRRERLLSQLSACLGTEAARTLRQHIMKAEAVCHNFRESRTVGNLSRAEYVCDLIARYDNHIWEQDGGYDNMRVVALASSAHPVTNAELEMLADTFRETVGTHQMKYGLLSGTDERCGDELHVLMVVWKRKK